VPDAIIPEFPQCPCTNCRSRVAEAVSLRARANLLRRAIAERETYGVVANHAVELLAMMESRGMA